MFRVGVIGYGHWGRDLSRNFVNNPKFKLVRIAEWDADLRNTARRLYPNVDITADADSVCSSPDIDVVVITTPASMQHELALRAVAHGKRVIAGAGRQRRRRSIATGGVRSLSIRAWLGTALYCGFIFYLSSLSDPSQLVPNWINWARWDKAVHALIFGGLAAAAAFDLYRSRGTTLDPLAFFLFPVLIATTYGVFDEAHQLFVFNRSFELRDVLADFCGAAIIAGALTLAYRRKRAG